MAISDKRQPGNFFEEFTLGQRLVHATPRTLSDGDAALYIALTGSRNLIAGSAPAAHALGYERQPIDDLLLFHVAFGKTVPDVSLNAVANLGYADVRFLRPAFAGDTIRAESEVIGLKQTSRGDSGIVYVRSEAFNQHGERLLTWIRWVMVQKRDADAPAPETVVPELPDRVATADLPLHPGLNGAGFESALTGSPHRWEDYAVGERIDHDDGMTVDNSDHTLATKLYQNTAKVHFDAHRMRDSRFGQRLIYGGHVISLARALSHNGLANALSIVAINGGSHSNPLFAGDTVYAWSEVLERIELPGRTDLGALRLRTVATRNAPTAEVASAKVTDEQGRERHDPRVILDLDYTVLMPRRAG